jgi:N-acetylglucosamine malate deacetylase 1
MRNWFRLLQESGIAILFCIGAGWAVLVGKADPPNDSAPRASVPEDGKLRIICFGAHPDDAELKAGGVAALWSQVGHHVKLVSVTNGDTGHWGMAGGALAQRRTAEALEADRVLGAASEVLDIHNSELEPNVENRKRLVRLIRGWDADVVMGHRPNDYHPDHRYVGVLMQDTAFIVTVPFYCPDAPALKKNPVYLYYEDGFKSPTPFRADVVVSIDAVIDRKLAALLKIESQFIEGSTLETAETAPKTEAERQARAIKAREKFRRRYADIADRFRDKLIELYGPEEGRKVRYAEAFEICEYGKQPTAEELRTLFPFLPKKQ